jgi:hypothetical protein
LGISCLDTPCDFPWPLWWFSVWFSMADFRNVCNLLQLYKVSPPGAKIVTEFLSHWLNLIFLKFCSHMEMRTPMTEWQSVLVFSLVTLHLTVHMHWRCGQWVLIFSCNERKLPFKKTLTSPWNDCPVVN